MQHHTVTAELSRLHRADLRAAADVRRQRETARRSAGPGDRRVRWPALLAAGRLRRRLRPATT